MDTGSDSYRRFLQGDESGLLEIVRDYKDGLILYLYTFVHDIHTAEDLAEDTFVKLCIKKPKDRGDASFKTWLYTIGRNLAIDHLRRRPSAQEISLDVYPDAGNEAVESLENVYIREERKRTVHRTLARLKAEYRQVLWLVYFEDFPCKEAAKVLKKSVHGTETLLYRARIALRTELEKEGFTYEELP